MIVEENLKFLLRKKFTIICLILLQALYILYSDILFYLVSLMERNYFLYHFLQGYWYRMIVGEKVEQIENSLKKVKSLKKIKKIIYFLTNLKI